MPRPYRRASHRRWHPASIWLLLPLVFVAGLYLWHDQRSGAPTLGGGLFPAAPDTETARFAHCSGPVRKTCVVDGDTFWYQGTKIRIADINTPETSTPECRDEAQLGAEATRRLIALLNAGPFTLQPGGDGRDKDRYGRALRIVTRKGRSLGATLVEEGLAEQWQGHRRSWC